jgi:hypothetical protein
LYQVVRFRLAEGSTFCIRANPAAPDVFRSSEKTEAQVLGRNYCDLERRSEQIMAKCIVPAARPQ